MRLGTPPVTGTVKTSVLPSYSPENARVLPSGEKAALLSIPAPAVRRVAMPPWRLTRPQISGVGEDDLGLVHGGLLQQMHGAGRAERRG